MTLEQVLYAVVFPGLIGLVGFLAASFLPRRKVETASGEVEWREGWLRRIAGPLVVLAAFVVADVGLNQWHELWPIDGTQRYLAVAIAAAIAGVVHRCVGLIAVSALLRAGIGAALAYGVLSPLPEMYMPQGLLVTLTALSGVWLAVMGTALDVAAVRLPRAGTAIGLSLVALVAAPGIFKSGYAGGANIAGGLGTIAGGAFVVAAVRGEKSVVLAGMHTVWLAVWAAVLLVTYGYQEVPAWWALPIMAIAPIGVLASLAVKHRGVRVVVAALAAAMIAAVATVAVVAVSGGSSDGAPEDEMYYEY